LYHAGFDLFFGPEKKEEAPIEVPR